MRTLWEREAAGSSPATPTITKEQPNGFSLVDSHFPLSLFIIRSFAKLRFSLFGAHETQKEKSLRALQISFLMSFVACGVHLRGLEPGGSLLALRSMVATDMVLYLVSCHLVSFCLRRIHRRSTMGILKTGLEETTVFNREGRGRLSV